MAQLPTMMGNNELRVKLDGGHADRTKKWANVSTEDGVTLVTLNRIKFNDEQVQVTLTLDKLKELIETIEANQ